MSGVMTGETAIARRSGPARVVPGNVHQRREEATMKEHPEYHNKVEAVIHANPWRVKR